MGIVVKSSRGSEEEKTLAPGGATSPSPPPPDSPGTEEGMSGEARMVGGVTALEEGHSQRAFKPTQGEKGELAPGSIHLTPFPPHSDDYILGEFPH